MTESLHDTIISLSSFIPELILATSLLLVLILGLFRPSSFFLRTVCILGFTATLGVVWTDGLQIHAVLFNGMLKNDGLTSFLKILMNTTGIFTCLLSIDHARKHPSEYFALLTAVVLGGHLLVMSTNFLILFLALEMISLASYVLAGYAQTKKGSEGSLKYFLFGSVASAVMLYGFSLLYGVTGTIDFSTPEFLSNMLSHMSPLVLVASVMAIAGFLYKIAAAPMHAWAPDVYEASPVPVIAFLSVAPKLAGLGILLKFILAVHAFGQSPYDWQAILCAIAFLTLGIGNFSALSQKNPKRMMAYSSIAQSGFMLLGLIAFLPQGVQFMLFYATIYLFANFLVFIYLDFFEKKGIHTISEFSGIGKDFILPAVFLLMAFISLTGLPPTAGFTSKLFVFTGLWQSYELNGKSIILWLLIFGLLNTVIALFYYLRIPYFAFLKSGKSFEKQNIITFQNFFALILVLLLLMFFFMPGVLMSWIKGINFVL